MKGEVAISDFAKASFFQYEGALCIRCSTSGSEAVWFFRVPQFDAEIIEEHWADLDLAILLQPFLVAQRAVSSFRNQARQNHGEWTSPLYAQTGAA